MKKKILWMLLSFSLVAALVLTACPAPVVEEPVVEEPVVEEPVVEEEEEIVIGFLSRLACPWWIIAEQAFREAADDFGFTPIVYQPPQLTVEDQVRVMETWIGMGIDGVLFGANDPDAPIGVINQAIDAGIPVLMFHTDSPNSKRLLLLGLNTYERGSGMAKGLLAILEATGVSPPGLISYHTGSMVSSEDLMIWEGWSTTIEAAGYEITEPRLDGGDSAIALSMAETTIALYPDLVAMSSPYDYVGAALGKAVTDAGKIDTLPVAICGVIKEHLEYLETGAIDGMIDLVQYDENYLACEILYKLVQAGRENWDDVLKEYHPGYPADKELLVGIGWITTPELVDIEMWPEIAWIKTAEEWKEAYPKVWDFIR